MKKILLPLIFILLNSSLLFAWIDTTGSTRPSTSGEWEIKDIQNDVHDRDAGAWKIQIASITAFLIDENGHIWVRTSSNSYTRLYYGGNVAKIDSDGRLQVETSTDSRVQIYYGTHSAIVRDGSTDDNLSSEKGLLVQSNAHAFNSNKWHRLLVESTNYHNLRVGIFTADRQLEVDDWDTDNQAEGRDGIIVYSYLSAWDEVNDDWDRARLDEMKNLKVFVGSNSIILSILNPVTSYIQNFPTDYPDSAAQSSLSNIETYTQGTRDRLKDVAITSGTVKKFQGQNSTGTVIVLSSVYHSTYTPQSGAVEIFVQSKSDNTDIIRYQTWLGNSVKTTGLQLGIGLMDIIDTWKNPIYLQAESGTPTVIIHEIDE